jgi:single-stranded-DNA-specific exonuclease
MKLSFKPEISPDNRAKLDQFNDVLAKILFHKNILDNESASAFLDPEYDKNILDPFLLKDSQKTVDRIFEAILNNQKICIFSDYDADGIPGAVVLAEYFQKINYENFFNYIPHRNKEGFGLNKQAIQKIKDNGTDLIITIDCGITDVEPIKFANELNMQVVITDHHEQHGMIPPAFSIINPKQHDCSYPNKNLCGSGVIFKLVQALIQTQKNSQQKDLKNLPEIPDGWEKWLLDLVGIATISDMVPLIGENRVFAKYGLLVLRKTKRKGLLKLFKKIRLDADKITEEDIGFGISPRINAASRMDAPEIAFRMLYTKDDLEATETVSHLDKINNERKGKVASMVKDIKKFLKENENNLEIYDSPIVVRGHTDWQPSLLGLAASSIVETYNKPVFLWGKGDGENFKGSCRSNGSVSLVKMMQNVKPDNIYDFGGHEMAGGFAVHQNAIFDLHSELENAFHLAKNGNGEIDREIIIDHKLKIDDIDWELFNQLEKMAPFGIGNDKPNFQIIMAAVSSVEFFGKEKNHLKIIFNKSNNKKISAIKFFNDDVEILEKVKTGDKINLIVNLEKSNFGYYPELRMRILHLEI